MSYKVNFYNFGKKVNSTAQPTGSGTEYDCIVRTETGILNPSVTINYGLANPPLFNYCKIPVFNRYYWVREWSFVDRLWTAELEVDPMASFKTGIGSSTLYITRSSYSKNGYIADMRYPISTQATISQVTDASPYWWTIQPNVTGGVYIVGILGRIDSGMTAGGITYLCLGPSQFRSFTEELFKDDLSYYIGGGGLGGLTDDIVKMIFKPYDYIASVTWLPSEPANTSVSANGWHVGFWSYNQAVKVLSPAATLHFECQYSLADHPQAATRGEYLNTAPYTQRVLRLPRVGSIVLDSSVMANISQITIVLEVDPITGAGVYEIYGSGLLLERVTAQIGVSVQLTSTGDISFGEYAGDITKVVGGAIQAAEGSPIAGTANILSAVDVFSPHISVISSQGGYLGLQGAAIPRLYNVFRTVVDDDNTEQGRPLCVNGTISSYPGYIEVLNADISLSGATRLEMDNIRSTMESGFYYE